MPASKPPSSNAGPNSAPRAPASSTRPTTCRALHRSRDISLVHDDVGRPLPPVAVLEGGHTIRGDVLIGADGVGFVVFRTLPPHAPSRPTGGTCWRAIVLWEADRTIPRGLMREVWGRGRRFGINRIDEGQAFIWAMGSRPAGVPARDLDHLALLGTWYGRWAIRPTVRRRQHRWLKGTENA